MKKEDEFYCKGDFCPPSSNSFNNKNLKYLKRAENFIGQEKPSENVIREMIELYKTLYSWDRVVEYYNGKYTKSTIINYVQELLSNKEYNELINQSRKRSEKSEQFKCEYEKALLSHINHYVGLIAKNFDELKISDADIDFIFQIYLAGLNKCDGTTSLEKFQNFYYQLYVKSPIQLSAIICYVFIQFYKDLIINGDYFLRIIDTEKSINLHNFTISIHQFILNFFELNFKYYSKRVQIYLELYLEIILQWKKLTVTDEEKNNLLKNELLTESLSLYANSINNGFQINFDTGYINYYFPQNLALSILFYVLKNRNLILTKDFIEAFRSVKNINLDTLMDSSSNRFYPYFKQQFNRYKGQQYNRDSFINILQTSLSESYLPEIELILELYKSSDLGFTPQDFLKELGIYTDIRHFLSFVEEGNYFKSQNSYNKIREYIYNPQNKLNSQEQVKFLSVLSNIYNLRMKYNRQAFIDKLESALSEFYSIDINFLLSVFEVTTLDPIEFARRLDIYNGSLYSLLRDIIDNRASLTHIDTFEKFRAFIKDSRNKISKEDQLLLLAELEKIQNLRRKTFTQKGILYPFQWIESKLNTILYDGSLRNSLYEYLSNISKQKFPLNLFEDPTSHIASDLQFVGPRDKRVKTSNIEDFFMNKSLLNASEKYNLSSNVRDLFENYRVEKIGYNPEHDSVLSYILDKNKNALAVEIPVWKSIRNSMEYFIGHVDLLLIDKNNVIIADYKQDKTEIFKAIPQIMAYAIMFNERIRSLGYLEAVNISCIGFCRDIAYEFNPYIIIHEIPEFLDYEKLFSNRQSDLMNVSKSTTLFEEIGNLIR